MIEYKAIGNFAKIISGFAFKSEWFGTGEDKVIRIGDLINKNIDINHALAVNTEKYKVSHTYKIQKNDILMALSGATVGKIAIAKSQDVGAYINQRVAIIRADNEITANYLKYFFEGKFLNDLLKNAGGVAQPNLSPKQLLSMEIPLPSLPEQKRIADILDKADDLRQKRQQSIAKLDELLQAIFIDMFGDPVTNPKGWETKKVKEVVDEFIGGKNVECPDESNSDFRILKVSAVTSKIYKSQESKKAPNNFIPNPLAIVKKGDLLFSRANTTELVAATAYVWETPENTVLPDKLWKFSITKNHLVNTLYLWDLFKNIGFRNELSKLSSGTSGSMKNIAKSKLNEVRIPVPPIELQNDFADISEKLWQQKQLSTQQLTQQNNLFQSLQQQAFNDTL